MNYEENNKKSLAFALLIAVVIGSFFFGETSYAADSVANDKLIKPSDNPNIINAPWRFADALKNSVNSTATDLSGPDADGNYSFIIKNAYEYPGYTGTDKLDICFKIIPVSGEKVGAVSKIGSAGTSEGENNLKIIEGTQDGKTIRYVALFLEGNQNKAFDYEVWLQDTHTNEKIEVKNVPIVVGPCYQANEAYGSPLTPKLETVRLYSFSGDKTIYTSIPETEKISFSERTQGWMTPPYRNSSKNYEESKNVIKYPDMSTGEEYERMGNGENGTVNVFTSAEYDKPYHYILSLGYKDEYTVKNGYTSLYAPKGACELRIGYKSYTVEYVDKTSGNATGLPTIEYVPAPNAGTYYSPSEPTGVSLTGGYTNLTYKIEAISQGESKTEVTDATITVRYDNGTIKTFKKGDIVTPDDIKRIQMEYNLDIGVYGKSPSDISLTYDTNNENVNLPEILDVNYKTGSSTTFSNTTTSKLAENQIIDGTDDRKYKFLGWDNKEDGTGGFFNFEGATTPDTVTADKTIYAKWERLIKVDFNLNGSEAIGKPDDQHLEENTSPSAVANPTRTGYTFLGWSETKNGPIIDITKQTLNADKTFYAIWTPVGGGYIPPSPKPTVKLEFETEIGPKPDTQSGITPGTTGKDPSSLKPGDEVDGNIFQGWFLDPDGKIPFDFSKPIDKDTKVYAKWEKKSGADGEKPDGEKDPDGTTPDGTAPDGTTPDGTTPDGTTPDGTTPDSTPSGTTGDTGEKVKVTFKTDIGVTPESQSVVPGNTAVDPQAPMDPTTLQPGTVINGYRFEGWFLDPEFKTAFDFKSAIREDTVLYAKWVKVGTKNQSPKTGVEDYYGIFALVIVALGLVGFISLKPRKRDRFS